MTLDGTRLVYRVWDVDENRWVDGLMFDSPEQAKAWLRESDAEIYPEGRPSYMTFVLYLRVEKL